MSILETFIDSANTVTLGSDEARRFARRRSVREQLAVFDLRDRQIEDLRRNLSDLDARSDLAADVHSAACGPIQDQLKTVEGRILASLANREATNPSDDAERADLLKQLATANEELTNATMLLGKLRNPLAAEIKRLVIENVGRVTVEQKLFDEGIGNPRLLTERTVCASRLDWARKRKEYEEEMLGNAKREMARMRDESERTGRRIAADSVDIIGRRIALRGELVRDARQEVTRLKAAHDEINRRERYGR